MRRTSAIAVASAAVVLLAGAVGGAASASGTSRTADLAAGGYVAGGERSVESFNSVVFVFSLTNNGPSTVDSSADLYYASVRNGRVSEQLCIEPGGGTISPDPSYCEYGTLAPGRTAHMTLIVKPRTGVVSGDRVTVKVCSTNESEIPDPVASNDCTSRSVAID
jgi:hypothetical protein